MPRDLIALFFFPLCTPPIAKLPSEEIGKKCRKRQKKKVKNNSDRGNRTPGCRVRDGDVNHYTISELPGELRL